MANRTLFVPGTGGVTLVDGYGTDVGWPVLMRLRGIIRGVRSRSDGELVERLGMEHRPGQLAPARTSLQRDVSLHPGRLLRVAVNQLERHVTPFLYDWRADLRWSAGRLLDVMRERRPAGGRWHLVGHSQGALLIVLASKLLEAGDALSEHVASATLVGAPAAGTLSAARAMIVGDDAGRRLAPVVRRVVRTWPAIYQMLPAWPAAREADGEPAPSTRQLTEPAGWPGVDGIQQDLLLRAREAHGLLREPLSHLQGVDVRFYWADNRRTLTGIRRPASGPLGWAPVTDEAGDALVPFATTLEWIGPEHGPYVTRFRAPVEPHAYLLNDPAVVSQLRRRLG